MRAKTVKRLAILIVAFVLVGGSAYAVWRFRVEKMARGVVEQADLALEKKNYIEALDLYQQHLLIFPDDMAVQLKYADVVLKLQHTPRHQQNAMGIYNEILRREPGREDVRRRAAELALIMPGGMYETARGHLSILLKSAPNDGHLEFMMGQCYEEDKDPEKAARYFRFAIEHGSPERFEASQRLAALIRENEKLGKPEDADKVIDEMVAADPTNYQVYMDRGHYLRRFNLEGAEAAFEKSLELAPEQPQTYLELAQLAERNTVLEKAHQVLDPHRPLTFLLPTALDVARQVLDNALAKAPSHLIYEARAELERKTGRFDRFIEVLENGIKVAPQQTALHLHLAMALAAHGDTGKLLLHIEELKGLGISHLVIDYLTAYYRFNNKEFERAKQILISIQLGVAQNPDFKARVNVLLAQCYSQLHEPEKEWDARQRAFNANPGDLTVQAGWINGQINRLLSRGEIDEAIKEYQRLLSLTPQIDRKRLVNLMLMRNRQRPPDQRDWHEVEVQLDELAKAQPDSAEPIVLRALFYADQDQAAKAWETLEAARSRFSDAVEPWTAEAELLVRQKKFDEALARLDSAQKHLGGDRIELRLARAAIWVSRNDRKDEEVVKVLNGLARDLEPFAKDQRRGLLSYLALELAGRQDVKTAEEIWLRLAQDDPEDVKPHLQLFDLALKAANKAEIDRQAKTKAKADIETEIKAKAKVDIAAQLKAIERIDADIAAQLNAIAKAEADIAAQLKAIEGIDDTYGRFYRARYLTWQAGRSRDDKDEVQRKKLRDEAHALLTELKARRDEWDLIPVAEAALEDQELAEVESDETLKREKQESIINLLLSAIELGSRNPDVVRRAVGLLFSTGRSNEAIQLFNRMAGTTPLGSELGLIVARLASAQNNQRAEETTRKAEELARKAIAAKPDSVDDRIWLVQILMAGKRTGDAEKELRQVVAQAEGDPKRWLFLVNFLIQTKQLQKAEQALRDAEKKLPQAPLALAECCDLMGQAHEGPNTIAQAKKWYDEARQWFERALAARTDPKDKSVTQRFVQFLLHTNPVEGEKQLQAILGPGAGAKDPATRTWARRTLALKYINTNPRRPADALALYDTVGPQGTGADPEDRRVWTRVLLAQETPEHRRAAIECLESLVDEKLANPEDQQLLARIEEAAGDWPKSRDQYRKLAERMSSLSDPEGRKRRIVILTEFAGRLLQSHQPSEDKDQDLAEAQQLIEKLNQLQPQLMATLNLEVALHAARNNFEAAAALIRTTGERGDLNPAVRPALAQMAEKIGRFDEFKLAEEIYRKLESAPGAPFNPNKVHLIRFLVRRGRVPEALDLCESIRKNAADRRQVDGLCLEIFGDPGVPASLEQVKRVIGWFEEEDRNNPQAMMYQIGLGNFHERLGQDQQAEEYYRAAIKSNDRDGVASNNLAWLMALRGGKWQDALDLINRAIAIKGPIPDYLDTRGVVYLSAGEGQRAIADLTAAINQSAFNGQPNGSKYFHLAQAYLAVHDQVNAKKSLDVAKTKGLPVGLHRLEIDKYQQMLDKLKN